MKINQQQIDSVLLLPGRERYDHFIKTVVDWEEAWGLYQDGWALAETEENEKVFPLWPAKEYAELCAKDIWEGYKVKKISLEELGEELLPSLEEDGIFPGIFYTPLDQGVVITVEEFISDLNEEVEMY